MSPNHSSTPSPEQRANFRTLYVDVAWFGVLAGSIQAFLSIYIAEIGGSAYQLGLMAAGPAFVNLLLSLPVGRGLQDQSLLRITFLSSIWNRVGYLALIPLPWLLAPAGQVWMMVVLTLVMSVPGTVLAIAFNALFADVVPPEWRGHVVGRRNAILAAAMVTTSLLSGQLLKHLAFPLNYQVVFALGTLGAGMSSFALQRLKRVNTEQPSQQFDPPLQDAARPGLMRFADAILLAPGLRFLARRPGSPLLRLDLLRSPFGLLLAAYLVFYASLYVPSPLFPLIWVRELKLSSETISLGNALVSISTFAASLLVGRLSDRYDHHRVLLMGAMTFWLYPLLNGLARDATLYMIASFIGGGSWALVSAGQVSRLMERVPQEDRPAHMALYNLVLNLGMLSGSLFGPILGGWLGLRPALLLAAGLRLLAGVLVGLWG
jgi:MFS family permease